MKTLLFILLPVFVFAQYGKNLFTSNGDFELDSGWSDYLGGDTNERSSTQAHGGTYSRHLNVNANNEGCIEAVPAPTLTSGNVYLVGAWFYRVSGSEVSITDNSSRFSQLVTTGNITGAWQKLEAEKTGASTGTTRPRLVSSGGAAEFYVDDLYIRNKLDTLYIDTENGDDADEGDYANNIKTYEEASLRGFYTGGVVMQLVNGTYIDITGFGGLYSGNDKGFKEHSKFKRFKSLK